WRSASDDDARQLAALRLGWLMLRSGMALLLLCIAAIALVLLPPWALRWQGLALQLYAAAATVASLASLAWMAGSAQRRR
ncbi:MAG: hypothetical protein WAQ05_21940, partial [Rubrivivax sp.]